MTYLILSFLFLTFMNAERIHPKIINSNKLLYNNQKESINNQNQDAQTKENYETEMIEVNITMPDNISLFGRITRPKVQEKFPVILIRSPYMFYEPLVAIVIGTAFAQKGYICITVYDRGTVKSQGEWLPFENDRNDGIAIIDWISKQDWCDGNIGTYGFSYSGYDEWCIADYNHPNLKTMYISVYGGHPYNNFYRRGMFKEMIWSGWSATMMEDNRFKWLSQEEDWNLRQFVYNLSIQANLGEELKGKPCDWYKRLVTGVREDGDYWGNGFWKEQNEIPEKVKIPIFIHGGWFDPFIRSQIDSYRRLPKETRQMSRFLIGPWGHSASPCGSLSYPGENVTGFFLIDSALKWFDHQLKGKQYPHQKGVIESYCIKGDKWITWKDDFHHNKEITFYFKKQDNQKANLLVTQNSANEQSIEYIYDPENPVQSLGGNMITNNRIPGANPDCCIAQNDPGNRSDVISFISENIGKDAWMTGSIEIHLFVSSSANATAFTVKVIEVFDSGEGINIVDDITDIRWIDEEKVENYAPGTIRELIINMTDVSWKISSTSKVRVDISSSNFPYYNAHPNFDKVWSETSEKFVAKQTIYTGGKYQSRIILPIQEEQAKKNKKTKILIIGISLIAALLIILIIVMIVLIVKKRKSDAKKTLQFQDVLMSSNSVN